MLIDRLDRHECAVIIGAGGHGKVVADALIASGCVADLCFADDVASMKGQHAIGIPVAGSLQDVLNADAYVHVAIGSNAIRQKILRSLIAYKCFSVVHPNAIVSNWAQYGPGTFIAAMAVIGPDAKLGQGVIVNHAAVVDHDCEVGDFAHIAPGATLAGGVHVGAGVLIGAGARVLPGVCVGAGAVIGAGAVVTKDVLPGFLVSGVPATNKRKV
jgi:sugar O-acyltransferase (sialic acid O-acetyltransferase NeuD family)